MDGDSPASPPSGGISRSRKPASIVTPADKEPALDLSDSGRFQCGLVSISNKGLIVSDPASASEPDGSLESGKVPSTVTFELGPEDFDPLEIVGHGASSYVRKALHKKSQTVMALKVIRVFEVEKVKALMTEISTLYNAECPQLVTFHGAFSHEGAVSIALEFATAGSLTDLVRLSGGMTEQTVALIVEQILLGLRFMHKDRHLVHRDFKPSNLLVDHSGRVFLTDFGVAGNLKSSGDLCATFVGTYLYMSPERFSGEQYSYSADVWSLGIVILECLTATFPWACSRGYWFCLLAAHLTCHRDLMNHIIHDPAPTVPEDPRFSDDLRSFVSRCLVKDPEQRASVVELLEHPFITSRLAHLSAVEKSTALSEWVSSLRSVFVCSMPRESIDPSQVAREFILLFHSLFAGRRHTLSSLYRPESTLTLSLRGAEVTATGREEIMGQLLRLDIHQTLDESADWKSKAALISAAGEPLMFRVEATGTVGHEAVDRFSEEMVLVEFPGSDSFWVQSHRLTVTTGPAVQ